MPIGMYGSPGGINTGPSFARPKPLGYDNGMSRTINQGIGGQGMTAGIRRKQIANTPPSRRPDMGGMNSGRSGFKPPQRPAYTPQGPQSRPGIPPDQPPMSSMNQGTMSEGPVMPPSGMMGGIGSRMGGMGYGPPRPMTGMVNGEVTSGFKPPQYSGSNDVSMGGRTFQPNPISSGFGGMNEQGGGMWDRYARMLQGRGMSGMNPFGGGMNQNIY